MLRARTRYRICTAIFAAILIWGSFFAAYSGNRSFAQHNQPEDGSCTAGCNKYASQPPADSEWNWFNILMVTFNGILAVSTILLWVETKRSVNNTERAVAATERAFVFIRGAELRAVLNVATNAVERWEIACQWENSGSTPTKALRLHINKSWRNDAELPEDFDYPDHGNRGATLLIGPRAEIFSDPPMPLSVAGAREVIAGTKHLFIWGWAEYGDTLPGDKKRRHRTEFCHKWVIGGDPTNTQRMSYRYTLYGKHNGADEECLKPLQTDDRGRDLPKR